jgi:peptidoglycan-N-acetylglucosamine deacetylase
MVHVPLSRYAAAVRWRVEGLPWWRSFPPRRLKDIGDHRPNAASTVALTFDDGPDPAYTPPILATLSDRDVRATFFVCGLSAERHPELIRAIVAEGHTIGGHTWHHVDIRGSSDETWDREVDRTHRLIEAATGGPVRYFRPPWGEIDRVGIRRLEARRITPVLWSSHGFDWCTDDPSIIVDAVSRSLQPGAIVLLHDACGNLLTPGAELPPGTTEDRGPTVASLPRILDAIEATGRRCVPLVV